MNKIPLEMPVIVEGKYDKIKLDSILDTHIITTDGFGIFNQKEKKILIRKLAEKTGVIVLTDSDGGGIVIRNYLNSILPKDKIIHLYIPQIEGRERRKNGSSKEGFLGVEGINADMLRLLFIPFATKSINSQRREITKSHFYADGLSGGRSSSSRRNALEAMLGLPANMSANALLAAINLLYTYDEYKTLIKKLDEKQAQKPDGG